MSLNSNRIRTQTYFEHLLGCADPADLKSYQALAPTISLNRTQSAKFREFCLADAQDFLFKGAVSILSAVSGLAKGRQTWPVVQLYYANYYLLRSELLLADRCILRANQVFTVLCQTGQKIEKVSNRQTKNDHDLTILFAKKYLEGSDVLLSQSIDDELPYNWLKKRRDWYQYKQECYIEVKDDGPFFSFEQVELLSQIDMFLKDPDPYFCFDPDYAALALPVKRYQLSLKNAQAYSLRLGNNERSILRRFKGAGEACRRLLQLLG